MSDMFKRGSTMLDDGAEVTCNWCGSKVKAFFAHYASGTGLFYHRKCWQEKKNA